MPGKMLAPSEAQITRWIVGAVESLGLLLLVRPGPICIDALVIRAILPFVRLIHIYVLRVTRFRRMLRIAASERLVVAVGRRHDHVGGEGGCWQRFLRGKSAEVGPRGCSRIVSGRLGLTLRRSIRSWGGRICLFSTTRTGFLRKCGVYGAKGGHL